MKIKPMDRNTMRFDHGVAITHLSVIIFNPTSMSVLTRFSAFLLHRTSTSIWSMSEPVVVKSSDMVVVLVGVEESSVTDGVIRKSK